MALSISVYAKFIVPDKKITSKFMKFISPACRKYCRKMLRLGLNMSVDFLLNMYYRVKGIRCGRVVSVEDFETGCPGFDPQSRHYGHGGVPLGKAHFLA